MDRIFVGIPSTDMWKAEFGCAVATMFAHFLQTHEGGELSFKNEISSILPRSRQRLAQYALDWGATHLLFLDSDMNFPADSISRLLAHRQPIVGANYVRKIIPGRPTAQGLDNTDLVTHKDSTGLQMARHLGFGVCLIETSAYKDLPKPWFPIGYDKVSDRYVGEDVFFCANIRANNIPIYIDHDLSKEVGHIGSFEYLNALCDVAAE